ncbi:hypothetical protein BY996DRAFT_6515353 [Phakopsora pachyrhizi]|nr:hypothetical protein BY996DRAFT_6515353 [Phakopsora pachyrhizi]
MEKVNRPADREVIEPVSRVKGKVAGLQHTKGRLRGDWSQARGSGKAFVGGRLAVVIDWFEGSRDKARAVSNQKRDSRQVDRYQKDNKAKGIKQGKRRDTQQICELAVLTKLESTRKANHGDIAILDTANRLGFYTRINFPPWQSLVHHQNNYNEHLFAHQHEALRNKEAVNFDGTLAPKHWKAPPDLRSEPSSVPEKPLLLHHLTSSSGALASNLESSILHQPIDFQSWKTLAHQKNHNEHFFPNQNLDFRKEQVLGQAVPDLSLENFKSIFAHPTEILPSFQNTAQHQEKHYKNREIKYQNSMNYYNEYHHMSQLDNSNGEKRPFLDEGNSKGNAARGNLGAYSPSHQNSDVQNQNWTFNTPIDSDLVDAQFNSMISAHFQTRSPHETNFDEENIYSSFLNYENQNQNTVESLNGNKKPLDMSKEVDHPQISLLCASISKDVPSIVQVQEKILKSSKSSETGKSQKRKRKHAWISESKGDQPNEQAEYLEDLEPNGGSINNKLRQKMYLEGLVGTSGESLEAADKELKIRLDEP